MKNILLRASTTIVIILTMSLLLAATVYADSGKGTIIDKTSTLSNSAIEAVEYYIDKAYEENGYAIAVVFDRYLDYDTKERITESYYRNAGFSKKGGILLYVGVNSRVYDIWRIVSNSTTEIDESELDYIAYTVENLLMNDRFDDAVIKFAELSNDAINEGKSMNYVMGIKTVEDVIKTIVFSLILGLIISLIIMFSMKSSMKTIKPQKSASGYTVLSSFKLNGSRDRFLYSRITRVAKPQNNSSGSGSRSSGGSHRGGRF